MKTFTPRIPIALVLAALVLTSCAPAAGTQAPLAPTASVTSDVGVQPATASETPEPEQGMPIEPGKNVLALIEGDARISHDNGGSWTATGTGQYLDAGDEIQLTADGLALVFLFNGAVIRLEGPSDFQLQRADKNDATGATQIIGRLWEGYGLFETNPLPTEDSLFQLYAMTSFIHVDYDAELAQDVGGAFDLDPERSIIAGGTLDDEDESLYIYRGPATIYVLGWDEYDQDYVAEVYPSDEELVIEVEVDFFVDPRLEANVEGFLDIAGHLVNQYAQTGTFDSGGILGYSLDDVEVLDTGGMLMFFLAEEPGLVQGSEFVTDGESRVTMTVMARVLYTEGGPIVVDVDVMIMSGIEGIFGCDPETGYGCPAPEGCDLDSGEGCELEGGCNLITREDCRRTHASCELSIRTDDLGNVTGTELVCPESKQLECHPNLAGDCDSLYDESAWADFDAEADDDEDALCWCKAAVPPGYPAPPDWMDMNYRCFCSDPGATPDRQ